MSPAQGDKMGSRWRWKDPTRTASLRAVLFISISPHLVYWPVNAAVMLYSCLRATGWNIFYEFHYALAKSSLLPHVWIWTRLTWSPPECRRAISIFLQCILQAVTREFRIPICIHPYCQWAVMGSYLSGYAVLCLTSSIRHLTIPFKIRYSWQHYQIKMANELKNGIFSI